MIDQRALPTVEAWVELRTADEVAQAIRAMVVRGAPAIGIAAAYGIALAATSAIGAPSAEVDRRIDDACRTLAAARPTAVNLGWAVERMRRVTAEARARGMDDAALAARLEDEARRIDREDLEACRTMGQHGAELVPREATVLTHCNAGGLATAGYGTALGVVRAAIEHGKRVRVLADETRPFLQGSRLTAWELVRDGIDTTLIADASAGALMRAGEVDLVIVGADRIAANGDAANKIGTYSLAVLARAHGIPFYVAAPTSTIDPACADGGRIPIEERDPHEILEIQGARVAPTGARARNPAFDVTPAELITAIVTERGILRPPYAMAIAALFADP
jgi:methylthioribose-1-phosphate isomerase